MSKTLKSGAVSASPRMEWQPLPRKSTVYTWNMVLFSLQIDPSSTSPVMPLLRHHPHILVDTLTHSSSAEFMRTIATWQLHSYSPPQ